MLQGAVRLGALTRESVLTETMYDNLSNQHNHRVKASIAERGSHYFAASWPRRKDLCKKTLHGDLLHGLETNVVSELQRCSVLSGV